jgi:hypothetical protein
MDPRAKAESLEKCPRLLASVDPFESVGSLNSPKAPLDEITGSLLFGRPSALCAERPAINPAGPGFALISNACELARRLGHSIRVTLISPVCVSDSGDREQRLDDIAQAIVTPCRNVELIGAIVCARDFLGML